MVDLNKLNQFTNINKIRLILGDQLNSNHSWYESCDANTLYVIAELKEEASYTRHHRQKLHSFFLAMAAFANSLERSGHQVLHLTLDDTSDINNAVDLLRYLAQHFPLQKIDFQQPDEYRLLVALRELKIDQVLIEEYSSEHFIVPLEELAKHIKPNKNHRMEQFYRRLRKQHDILMQDGTPLGGQWNYDASNRRKLKPADLTSIPQPLLFSNSVEEVDSRINKYNIETIGRSESPLTMPVDRSQSLDLLEYFCTEGLPRFGDFQDAMTDQSAFAWSLYHSRISFSLNTKMLGPMEVIQTAINAYSTQDNIDISQVEGFVRQILGWREFVRGIYWANMPSYAHLNHLSATRNLPDFYWTGETKMNCISQTVNQSLDHAYAHHIQRLMITGTFALLAGIDPDQVDSWYLGIYADAIEWVQLPNTRGMSQFADGGMIASKPYIASGNYVNQMSDYCRSCHYDIKDKVTSQSCPFNSMYWRFLNTHREKFSRNPRIGMAYRNWDGFDPEIQQKVLERGEIYLSELESL